MPIREFRCQGCDVVFEELFRSAADAHRPLCPKCGSRRSEKLFSVFGVGGGQRASAAGGSGSSSCAGCRAKSCATCRR